MLKKRLLDEELETWRNRPLDQIEYLILDARYEKVRVAGSVRDCAVLIAIGIQPGGHRSVLGVSVSLSEAEVHWLEFLVSLKQRGLHGVKLVVSDAHEGLSDEWETGMKYLTFQNLKPETEWPNLQNECCSIELKELRSISLDSTNVDDQAVDWLIELRQLKYINLAHTYITQEGVRRLRRELPGIHIAGVSSIGKRQPQSREESAAMKKQMHRHGTDNIPIFLLPAFFLPLILGMHLKLQFAAPRSQMVPDFAKAHLIVAGGLIASASGSLALAAWSASSSSLFAILALELACFAWFLWMAQLNSILMLFGLILGAGWFFLGADASTQSQLPLLFLPSAANAASVVLLLAALAALTGLAVRLTRFREEMSEYGMVVSFDMIWDLASRSSNRRRQQIEANVISKSVFNAWIMDTQFDFAIKHLPKKWLPRAVLLLHVTHGFAILWMIPTFVVMFWLFGTVISGFDNASNGLTNVAPIFLTSIIPMMCLSAIMGQWLQHWRWYAGELLRPQSHQPPLQTTSSSNLLA